MDAPAFKLNSRVRVARSAIPNATSFIGYTGTVCWVAGNEVGVLLDDPHNREFTDEPLMFLKRELDQIDN